MSDRAYMGILEVAAGAFSASVDVEMNGMWCVLQDGTRVEVRTTREPKGRLIVSPAILQRGSVDVFVLAVVGGPAWREPELEDVRLAGWATSEQLQQKRPEVISKRPDAMPVHALYQDRLRPIEELKRRNEPQTLSMF